MNTTAARSRRARDKKRGGPPRVPAGHGTSSRYSHGCRCDECTAAWATYQRARRALAVTPSGYDDSMKPYKFSTGDYVVTDYPRPGAVGRVFRIQWARDGRPARYYVQLLGQGGGLHPFIGRFAEEALSHFDTTNQGETP